MTADEIVSPSIEQVFDVLASIPEPCSIAMGCPETLASMGLVESIDVAGAAVEVCLVLTDPSCVHFMSMRRYITELLVERFGPLEVTVRMSTRQLWTPERMNPSAPPGGRSLLPMA